GDAAGTVSLDNLTSGELSVLTFIGAQSTGKLDANNEYAVRFVAGVNSLDYSKVGFTIVATPANGDTLKFETSSAIVYSSITASDTLGLTETYSATKLGCSYLSALSVKEIPTTAGEVTFEVTPFCEDAAGIRYAGETQTLTINADGTWKLS
ncbi:MAG: hypothetical protein IJY42_03375, partial [Clostridia bacterium]|nr:hypothetical protein [Clostridia bacterium]